MKDDWESDDMSGLWAHLPGAVLIKDSNGNPIAEIPSGLIWSLTPSQLADIMGDYDGGVSLETDTYYAIGYGGE